LQNSCQVLGVAIPCFSDRLCDPTATPQCAPVPPKEDVNGQAAFTPVDGSGRRSGMSVCGTKYVRSSVRLKARNPADSRPSRLSVRFPANGRPNSERPRARIHDPGCVKTHNFRRNRVALRVASDPRSQPAERLNNRSDDDTSCSTLHLFLKIKVLRPPIESTI
jgi:hypothetical protein